MVAVAVNVAVAAPLGCVAYFYAWAVSVSLKSPRRDRHSKES